MKSDYRIREMAADEVGLAVEWAAREGWNPGLHDAACFAAADPGGFLIGELDGAPVAVISAVRYGEEFGFIGLYIVAPEHRGRGYGLAIWRAAMEKLRGRNIGLDGVVAQQENYRKSGFQLAHRNARYEGVGGGNSVAAADSASGDIVELSASALDQVADYDRRFFPAARPAFLRAWIDQPEAAAFGVRAGGDGELAGYGVLRKCRAGYKIGPLFADTPAAAESLFSALTARAAAGAPMYLDIPATNRHARELARRHAMKIVFETARMYTGAFPDLPAEKIFGITTFELG